jgi:hypothetical protein
VELAVATNTAPSAWWDEDPAVVMTAVDVLDVNAKLMAKARRRG